jgi:formyl-CoA transferase
MANLFSDLKVLDIATFIAGPGSTTILSDFGADVIKIEVPGGDPYRNYFKEPPNPASSKNYTWQLTNRNKRSITLNLKSPRGQEILRKLVGWADVIVVNYPPRVRERLNLSYEHISAINPRAIYTDLTGYGERGPDANEPGFDITAYWARTGLMDVTRNAGCPPPLPVPGMGDQATGMTLYASILTGLYRREKTGQGCHVSSSLVAAGMWAAAPWVLAGLDGASFYGNTDRKHPFNALINTYETSDGRWFLLVVAGEEHWASFAKAVGHSEWVTDDRFKQERDRIAHANDLTPLLEEAFAAHPLDYWHTALDQARVPYGLTQTVEEFAHDPQLLANNYLVPIDDGSQTPNLTVDSPVYIEQEAKVRPRPAPELGQHTHEILKELAYSDKEIEELRASGVI